MHLSAGIPGTWSLTALKSLIALSAAASLVWIAETVLFAVCCSIFIAVLFLAHVLCSHASVLSSFGCPAYKRKGSMEMAENTEMHGV